MGRSEEFKKAVPTSPMAGGGEIDRISAAVRMFGEGSKQHKAAIKRWGKK